jgi:hypothetical protein
LIRAGWRVSTASRRAAASATLHQEVDGCILTDLSSFFFLFLPSCFCLFLI